MPHALKTLIDQLQRLPNIGPEFAQRLAFYLLLEDNTLGHQISQAINDALKQLHRCQHCQNYSEHTLCTLCSDLTREKTLWVVESPIDAFKLEHSQHTRGYYFVLHRLISPITQIGPNDLKLPDLNQQIREKNIQSIHIVTKSSAESKVTTQVIIDSLPDHVKIIQVGYQTLMSRLTDFIQEKSLLQ
jgi:recombination protein RecR